LGEGFVVEQTEGPYYKTGSPERTNIANEGASGEPLTLTGYVLDKDCNPIAGAWIDFWQADGNGTYDNTGHNLCGHQFTDGNGRYILQTVFPGIYPGRTNHIHVKLRKSESSPIVITTQLYFPDSQQNTGDSIFDPVMSVTLVESQGSKIAYFNFKLSQ
jgi:protocatechuate 3,4-dioxygenase beta subunit